MKQRVVKEEMVELDPALDFLPRSAEALFIQDVAAQVTVDFGHSLVESQVTLTVSRHWSQPGGISGNSQQTLVTAWWSLR